MDHHAEIAFLKRGRNKIAQPNGPGPDKDDMALKKPTKLCRSKRARHDFPSRNRPLGNGLCVVHPQFAGPCGGHFLVGDFEGDNISFAPKLGAGITGLDGDGPGPEGRPQGLDRERGE